MVLTTIYLPQIVMLSNQKSVNMKINFNHDLLDLEGNPVFVPGESVPVNLGKILGNALASQPKGKDPAGMLIIAMYAYKGLDIELSGNEIAELENFIKESESLTILAKGQLLKILIGQ